MATQQKQKQIDSLTDKLSKDNNFILLQFDKTTHQSLETLRHNLKKTNSFLKVLKNTLFEKAINKLSSSNKLFTEFRKKFLPLKDTSAILTFTGDWSEGLHAVSEFMQKEKSLSFKSGVLDKQVYEMAEVVRISKLPSKTVLMGNLISSLKSPAAHLTNSFKFNMIKFVYILQQKSKTA